MKYNIIRTDTTDAGLRKIVLYIAQNLRKDALPERNLPQYLIGFSIIEVFLLEFHIFSCHFTCTTFCCQRRCQPTFLSHCSRVIRFVCPTRIRASVGPVLPFFLLKRLNRDRQMGRAEEEHQNHRWKVMEPYGRTQKVQNRKYLQGHRDKEKRPVKQRDVPSAGEIANPCGIVQNQEYSGQIEPYTS